MLFVVSTGRSGSQTLALVLSQSPDLLCLHEPHPQLVKESTAFRAGRTDMDAVVQVLRRTRPGELDGRRYGETNNRLALLIPPLLAAFPSAQFIWLLRDGRDFVASELQRGAFRPPPSRLPWRRSKWDRWRLGGDVVGAVAPAMWASMAPFEKVAWQWGYVNRLIRSDLAELGPDRVRALRIEDVASSLPDLCAWLGIAPVPFHIPRSNARRAVPEPDGQARRHPNVVATVTGWQSWSADHRERFERHAADLMDEHYPGWRAADGAWLPLPAAQAERPPEADGAEAALRYAWARATVERYELRSELDVLTSTPALLATHLGVALRNRIRRR